MTKTICTCGICNKSSLDLLWDLPGLPLTEKYGPYTPTEDLSFDQSLLFCNQCGHVQLGTRLSPRELYSDIAYSFRTSVSPSAQKGSKFFYNFYQTISNGRQFSSLLDIGGNDLFLAQMHNAPQRVVVDPICKLQDGQEIDGIKIIGKFIEEVDFKKEGITPDLIFCRHVLEHIAEPHHLISCLFESCSPQALYIFEIPCLENLIEANRFDAVFHQHYHYFDLFTFQQLLQETGGTYLGHLYHRQGSCGGALLIAFQLNQSNSVAFPPVKNLLDRKKAIQRHIKEYEAQMNALSTQIQRFKGNLYGYGASLMLATLAYHLKTDFSELICILDDDPKKDSTEYKNIPVNIRYRGNCVVPENSNFLITSLENTRIIFEKITKLNPRRILSPFIS